MVINLQKTWLTVLEQEFQQDYFKSLLEYIKKEYETYTCYPEMRSIFAAFNYCSFYTTKVVIIGQDPYHGPGQANGLCFSVKDGVPHPPSLRNIFTEIKNDIGNDMSKSGNLERWANQGVLLLNATLTVRTHEPGSHQKKGWERFTDAAIKKLSDERVGLIFLLWGGFAKKKAAIIDQKKHQVLTCGHPSPLSANRGYWFGNKHFSSVNSILTLKNDNTIVW